MFCVLSGTGHQSYKILEAPSSVTNKECSVCWLFNVSSLSGEIFSLWMLCCRAHSSHQSIPVLMQKDNLFHWCFTKPIPHSASWWVTHICLNTDWARIQPFFSRYISHVIEDLIPYSKSCIYTNVREAVNTDKTACQIKKYHCTEQNSLSAFHTATPTNASSCFRNNFGFFRH